MSYSQTAGVGRRLVKATAGAGAAKILSLAMTLALSIILARSLGPEAFGGYAWWVTLIAVISLPLGPALTQFATRQTALYQAKEEREHLRGFFIWGHWVILAFSVLAVLFTSIYLIFVPPSEHQRTFFLVMIALPLVGLIALRTGVIIGYGHVFWGQLPTLLLRPSIQLIAVVVLIVFWKINIPLALGAFVLGLIFAFVGADCMLRRVALYSHRCVKGDLHVSQWCLAWVPFILLSATYTLNSQVGILLLGLLGSNEQVAMLHIADRGAQMVGLSLGIVNLTIGPQIVRDQASLEKARLQRLMTKSAQAATMIALPVAMPLIVLGDHVIFFVFGEEYAASGRWPLALLALGQLFNVAMGSVGLFLTMSGLARETLKGQGLALCVNLLLSCILIPRFGALGAAFAAATALVVWNVVLARLLVRRMGIWPSAISVKR